MPIDTVQNRRYALVTAAYNEGKLIENTIRSVVSQHLPPVAWVIVSDGSTDDTDAIINRYASQHSFIRLYRLTEPHARNFAAQANAINAGIRRLADVDFDFIGNFDADITVAPTYFDQLLQKFQQDAQLGLAGGLIHEQNDDGIFRSRPDNHLGSVAHAVQLFRRACFNDIGAAYLALPFGGPDTYAEVSARMKGWRVASFPDLLVRHHRVTGSAGGVMRGFFRQGRMDYSLGTLPLFEICKVLRRVHLAPFVLGAATRFAGFVYSYCGGGQRAVSKEFLQYLRREQKTRIKALFRSGPWSPVSPAKSTRRELSC